MKKYFRAIEISLLIYNQALDETSFTLQSSLSGAVIKDQLFGGLWLHLKFNSWSWISSFPDLPRTSNQRLQAQPITELEFKLTCPTCHSAIVPDNLADQSDAIPWDTA
ncbi:hypothetical protein ROHU_024392 [Labeo rohita]|uniref:Uncharacterized protein n=1 Tax=Labeo rohita TaxID=84645 RepID=A0A498MX33_LABRO|nr:hypothetical protein ROHU_024392 [Labeo rohita]